MTHAAVNAARAARAARGVPRASCDRPLVAFVWLLLMLSASEAAADLVFFTSGRSMSVRSVREDGSRLVLTLRGGGEISCDRALVERLAPDEVPYPEPELERGVATATEHAGAGETISLRDRPFADLIDRAARRHGVDARLVRAVVQVESGYHPRAKSRKGARGLMQLMPSTARQYAVGNLFDPAANVNAGVRHLRRLLDRLPLDLALAAYNAGEAAVARFQGIPPYPETQEYVARILKLFRAQPDTY